MASSKELQQTLSATLNKSEWYGHYFKACCVYHDDSNPSMFVYPDWFRCVSCGEQGTLNKLQQKLDSKGKLLPKPAVVRNLPPWKTWLEKYKTWENVCATAQSTAHTFPSLMAYMNKRKIDWKSYKLGWLDNYTVIPIYAKEKLVDIVVRSSPSCPGHKYILRPREFAGDFNLFVPNWRSIENANKLYFDFVGILDAISMSMAGFPVITGLNGQDAIERYAEALVSYRIPILVVADIGEEERAKKFVRLLGWRGKFVRLVYPDRCKDRNDIHRLYGLEKLRELILNCSQ